MSYNTKEDEALAALREKLNGPVLKACFLAHGSCGRYFEVTHNGKRACLLLVQNPSIKGPETVTFEFIDHDTFYTAASIIKAVVKVL